MEYEGLRKLAALQGLPEEDVLRQFKEAGINSLMIFDTTLERLTKNSELQTATACVTHILMAPNPPDSHVGHMCAETCC